MKTTVRIKFAKTGRTKYISHLDLMRCFQRCIRRLELPIAYSEGFHPHMLLTLAGALSLGFESQGEILELQLKEEMKPEDVMTQMQTIVPDGLKILSCYVPRHKMAQLGYAEYQVTLPCEDAAQLHRQWDEFLAQPEILAVKKTKRGMREMDLKEQTECLSVTEYEDCLVLCLRLPAGSKVNINPALFIETFEKTEHVSFGFPKYCRMKLLTTEKTEFF